MTGTHGIDVILFHEFYIQEHHFARNHMPFNRIVFMAVHTF